MPTLAALTPTLLATCASVKASLPPALFDGSRAPDKEGGRYDGTVRATMVRAVLSALSHDECQSLLALPEEDQDRALVAILASLDALRSSAACLEGIVLARAKGAWPKAIPRLADMVRGAIKRKEAALSKVKGDERVQVASSDPAAPAPGVKPKKPKADKPKANATTKKVRKQSTKEADKPAGSPA